jgi:hypothetical protein
MARGGGRAQTAPIPCPKCGGPMYDNIADKAAGKRPQKAPDYACKDRENCDHGVWLKDSEKNALQATTAATGGKAGRRPIVIDSLMDQCVAAAKEILGRQLGDLAKAPPELIVNMATTMFIARVGGSPGILKVEKESLAKAQAKAAEAERVRREEEERKAREQQQPSGDNYEWDQRGDDDDNPF